MGDDSRAGRGSRCKKSLLQKKGLILSELRYFSFSILFPFPDRSSRNQSTVLPAIGLK